MSFAGALVIGYGNPLRTDDGFGWHVAAELTASSWLREATVVGCHQLTPELAERIVAATIVLFIDAQINGAPPGTIEVSRLDFDRGASASWSHHCDPPSLMQLAGQLCERVPPAFLIAVEASDVSLGERMTPVMQKSLAGVVDEVTRLISESSQTVRR